MPNRTIDLNGPGVGIDFVNFTDAIAAAGTNETFDVTGDGVYTEAARLLIAKSMAFINTSGGDVVITQAAAQNVDVSSGSACVVEFTDIDFDLPAASAVHYNIGLLGAGAHNLKLTRCKFTTTHLSLDCLPVYHATGKSHELTDCEFDGHYSYLLYSDGAFIDSTVDGMAITQTPINGIFRADHVSKCVENADWRRIVGPAPRIVLNVNLGRNIFDCGTSGLFTASVIHGITTVSAFGTGPWVIEKSTLQGSSAYALQAAAAGIVFAGTFRDIEFVDFATAGVNHPDTAIADMIDNCGRWNCPALCSKVGSEGIHNISGDPLFVDEAGYNYRLSLGSPCIDAGTTCVATVDPDGVAIPQGGGTDIGGYEYPSIARLLTGTVTDVDEITITADNNLTFAIADPADWTVTSATPGATAVSITSIIIGSPTTTAVITVDAALSPRATYTVTTTSTDVEAGYRTVDVVVPSAGARLTTAIVIPALNTIAVYCDEDITVASNGTSLWSIALSSALGDVITLVSATLHGSNPRLMQLVYSGTATPGSKFLITTTSPQFEAGYKTVYAVVTIAAQDFTPEPFLPSMLSAIGKAISYDTGTPQTVLTATLTPGDATMYLESTLGFPATNGIVYIGGVGIEYATKTSYSLTGLTWPTVEVSGTDYLTCFDVYQIDTPVMEYSKQYSLQDMATNENVVNRCFGKQLERLANSYGLTVPLATMTDADIQEYLNERMYQDTGTVFSIFRTLRPVLRGLEITGTATISDAKTIVGVTVTDVIQQNFLVGRWVEINGKIAKIQTSTLTAPDTYTWEFVDTDGYLWEAPLLTTGTIAWRLIPFLFDTLVNTFYSSRFAGLTSPDIWKAAQFEVHLFIGNVFPTGYPRGYWLEDATVDMPGGGTAPTDGRTMHNYLATTDAVADPTGANNYLYMLDSYDYEITTILSELLPAGVLGSVIIY